MKKHLTASAALVAALALPVGSAVAQDTKPSAELKTLEQKVSYIIGSNLGKNMKRDGVAVDPEALARGVRDGMGGKLALTDAQVAEAMQAFQQQMMAKEANAAASSPEAQQNMKAGQDFLAANKAKPGITALPSGLQYKVIKSGTGKTPTKANTVLAKYRGTLIDGTEFDKSDAGIEFPVGGVIAGWTEILQKMKEGDKYQVFIPSNLAYGPGGTDGIPPNSVLIFDIELVKVVK